MERQYNEQQLVEENPELAALSERTALRPCKTIIQRLRLSHRQQLS